MHLKPVDEFSSIQIEWNLFVLCIIQQPIREVTSKHQQA